MHAVLSALLIASGAALAQSVAPIQDAPLSYVAALLTAVGALAGALVAMWVWWINAYTALRDSHKQCEDSKNLLVERVIRLEERTGTERRSRTETGIDRIP